jgi:TatD DNase family protein
MTWIDTHAHLDDGRFQSDLPAVLARAFEAKLTHIFTIGVDVATSRAAVALCEEHAMLRAVVGIQPNHSAEALPGDFAVIETLATHPKVVAIGETGLDRYWDRSPFALQQADFKKHLELARRLKKPVIIHCREAEADVVLMLQAAFAKHGPVAGVMHSFSGDAATAAECVRLGLHISFAGMLTYKSADTIREAAKVVPVERLLVETDSPYLAPIPHRGKRNEPSYVVHTATRLAEVKGISLEELATVTTANAMALFTL